MKNYKFVSKSGKYLISSRNFNDALFSWFLRVNEKIISVERILNDTQFKILKNLGTFKII
jgi:hypothetical protein